MGRLSDRLRRGRPELLQTIRNPLLIVALLMIGVSWLLVLVLLNAERDSALQRAVQRGRDAALLFAQHAERVIQNADYTLLVLRQLYETNQQDFDLRSWIRRAERLDGTTVTWDIIDARGAMVQSSADDTALPLYLGDRDDFIRTRDLTTDLLYIGEPALARASHGWSIKLARRLRNQDGSFAGVVVASLDPKSLTDVYGLVDLGPRDNIVLRNLEGTLLAAHGVSDAALGHKKVDQALVKALAEAPVGHYRGADAIDGVDRLVAYRKSHDMPLLMSVGLANSDIFAELQRHRLAYLTMAISGSFLLTFVVIIGMQHYVRLYRSKQQQEDLTFQFHAAIDNMPHGLSLFDRDQRLIVSNRRYGDMYNLTLEQTRPGTTLLSILEAHVAAGISPKDTGAYIRRRLEEVARPEPGCSTNDLMDGRVFAVDSQPMPKGGWVSVHQDITAQKRAEAQVIQVAQEDLVTGLANRAFFSERINEASARLRRQGEKFSILMLDLDRFKSVNDTYGHPAGDALLKETAQRLKAAMRPTDVLARLGGDEFAVIQPAEANQRNAAVALATRIAGLVAEPFNIDGTKIIIGTSVGIAMAPADATEPTDLLKKADIALYDAKANGQSGFSFFDPSMEAEVVARRELETELRNALADDQFELYYQPIVDARTRRLASLEALIRWRHPTRGLVLPGEFIPTAEETGLIISIGEWVLKKACAEAAAWPSHVGVAINLSPLQFAGPDLVDVILRALVGSGLAPERLELEITESVLMERAVFYSDTIRRIKALGVTLALDDFGTGYSSMTYLTMVKFDRIKIDKSFAQNLTRRVECAAIVASVLLLASGLGVSTVAEGVETDQQFSALRASGIDFVQGYLFGKPCQAAELEFDRTYSEPPVEDAASAA